MQDPYEVLGVPRTATQDEIRSAYRKLAKEHHPDLNPGNRRAEQRFKEIAAANDLLSDAEKRARFDRGEIDASGAERPERQYYRGFAEGGEGRKYSAREERFDPEDLQDLFGDLFGRGRQAGGFRFEARGPDIPYRLAVDFLEAAEGARKRLTLPDGRTLDVTIPRGLKDAQTIRLKGQGGPGIGGGPPGDALIEVEVRPHPFFTRIGNDVRLDLPITLGEALNGARISVPTLDGKVTVKVPPKANSGTILRLKGKGFPADGGKGDQLVRLQVGLPPNPDPELTDFIVEWEFRHPYDPRQALEGGR